VRTQSSATLHPRRRIYRDEPRRLSESKITTKGSAPYRTKVVVEFVQEGGQTFSAPAVERPNGWNRSVFSGFSIPDHDQLLDRAHVVTIQSTDRYGVFGVEG
jgi:hypothetical protein